MTLATAHVRPIEAGDYDAVAALLAELGRPAVSGSPDDPTRAVFARHISDPSAASLIAEVEGGAAGLISLHFRERLNHPTLEAWVPDLIVAEEYHGAGVGPALLRRAVELARERGCHRLTLESGCSSPRAPLLRARGAEGRGQVLYHRAEHGRRG
ncbi:MAG: GNAT family N-acetyltransferase [Chloroflexia bacterium]